MSPASMFYENLEKNFVSWAQSKEDIRAAFMVGSHARSDHPADEWSDMDIILYTSKPDSYLSDAKWVEDFGKVWTLVVSRTSGGEPECLTLFEGGWQVDFVFHTIDDLKQIVEKRVVPDNFNRGVKVLVDKDNIADKITPKCFKAPQGTVLSEEAFVQTANMFWFLALYIAKQIMRNDLWMVKVRDTNMKEFLLQMIEWHEKVVNGSAYDTWHAGRFICEWASPETRKELQSAFGHFDRTDSWRALADTIALFERLSHDIAQRKGFAYPYALENNISDWIRQNAKGL